MKKHVLLIAIVGLLSLTAVLLIFMSPEQPSPKNQQANKTPAATYAAAPDMTPVSIDEEGNQITPPGGSDELIFGSIENLPTPSAADISDAIFSSGDEIERKFLTPEQEQELAAAAVVKHDPLPRFEQQLNVAWQEADLSSKFPDLPTAAPIYILERPTGTRIFNVLKTLADALQIKGSVVRMDQQNYAVANIATGDYYLFYDLFHLTFDAEGLALKLAATGTEAVKQALTDMGLLRFAHTATTETDDETGDTWVRFTPQLTLPIVSLEQPTDVSGFTPGKTGTVDVKVAGDTIVKINNSFPNITEKSTAEVATKEDLLARIKEGVFRLGDVQLQYPGAMALEDKRQFFTLSGADQITITDAELSNLECGYLVETDQSVQALLAPVCIVHGKGKVDAYSVLFRVVVSAVK